MKKLVFLLLIAVLAGFTDIKAQDYATIYVYRVKKLTQTGKDFKIYLNSLEIATIPNGGRLEYRYYNEGRTTIMAGVFSEYTPMSDNYNNNLVLEIKKGERYYLKGEGNSLSLVEPTKGKSEFERNSDFKGEINFIDNKPFNYDAYASKGSSEKPPRILLTEPAIPANGEHKHQGDAITLKGTVGSGVAIREIVVNGTEAIVKQGGDFTAVVSLNEQNNSVIIKAVDVNGLKSEMTVQIIKEEPSVANNNEQLVYRGGGDPMKGMNVNTSKVAFETGNYYALIIGIDKYKGNWTPLNNAVNDAKAISTLLNSSYKFNVIKTLFNEQATRGKIISELEWLVENVKENDNVLIYYSGHGEYKSELNKGFWVPVDASTKSTAQFISNSDIQTYIGGIKSKHTLLIADACFSGDIFRGNAVSVPFENSEKYYSNVYNLHSRQAISSGGIEPVMDGGRDGHSVFAYYLLQALKANSSKYFDSGQVFEKIKIPVTNNSEQTPKFNPLKNTGDAGGHFIFIRK